MNFKIPRGQEMTFLLTASAVYGATIGFTIWYVGPMRYDEWGLPMAVSWIFCLALAARWPNTARLTTLFHGGWSLTASIACWYRVAVLGFFELKFGGPRGSFVVGGSSCTLTFVESREGIHWGILNCEALGWKPVGSVFPPAPPPRISRPAIRCPIVTVGIPRKFHRRIGDLDRFR